MMKRRCRILPRKGRRDSARVNRVLVEQNQRLAADARAYKVMFDQAAVGMGHVDLSGKFVKVNKRYSEIVGYPVSELIQTSFQNITYEPDLARDQEYLERLLKGEIETYTIDKRYIRKDRTLAWVSLTVSLVKNETGDPSYYIAVVQDIHARKEAEEARRQSEERLRLAFTAGELGSWSYDLETAKMMFSDEQRSLFGLKEGSTHYTLEDFYARIHLDDRKLTQDKFQKAIGLHERYEDTFRISVEDGKEKFLMSSARFYRSDEKPRGYYVGVCLDITARKLAEVAAIDSERRLRAILEHMPIGVMIVELPSTRIQFYNRQLSSVIDVASLHSLCRCTFHLSQVHDYECQPMLPKHWPLTAKVAQGKTIHDASMIISEAGGSERFLSISAAPICSQVGKIDCVVLTVQDVTEQKRSEDAVRRSESNLRQLADSIPHIVWTSLPNGDLRDVNRQWYTYTGLSVEETFSSRSHEVVHPDELSLVRKACTANIDFAQGRSYEYRLRRHDGVYRWHLARITPILDDDDRLAFWIGTATDIDDRKKIEKELYEVNRDLEERVRERTIQLEVANEHLRQEVAERERSNRDLEQFAYIASHDLQEPLRAVASYVGLLARRYRGQFDDRANSYIKHAVEGAARMQSFINDLLTFSRVRPASGAKECVDLSDIIREAIAALHVTIKENRAVITYDNLPFVPGFPGLLKQLFQNLIANSIKFRSSAAPRIEITAQTRDGDFLISLSDNGIGIESEHFERVFEIFQKLHSREQYPGTGLGLAICRKVVEQHGGEIWVTSTPGLGSSFHFTLSKGKVIRAHSALPKPPDQMPRPDQSNDGRP